MEGFDDPCADPEGAHRLESAFLSPSRGNPISRTYRPWILAGGKENATQACNETT